MFAVKGWAVDASTLKPQTKPIKSSKAQDALDRKAAQNEDKPQQSDDKASLKRKREQTQNEPDLGKQWDKHVEGKDVSKPKPLKKKDNKKQKREENATEGASKKDGAQVNRGKEQKGTENKEPKAQSGSKKEKKKGKQGKGDTAAAEDGASKPTAATVATLPPAAPPLPSKAKLTPMQAAMRQKLISARFRHLNETLYTAPSAEALELFDSNPEMFEDYHAGFRQQVEVWPENPVDNFLATIRQRGKVKQSYLNKKGSKSKPAKGSENDAGLEPLPRTHGTAIIADLGCGDARLAHTLTTSNEISSLNLKLHSFDLHSPSKHVTKADISSLPLADGSADVAIFCLALMGTNWISFIEEAYRILHWKGELWVAEIKSRFGRVDKKQKVVDHSVGSKRKAKMLAPKLKKKEQEQEEANEQQTLATEVDGVEPQQQPTTDVHGFVEVLRRRGFVLKEGEKSIDLGNKMFVKMEFIKAAAPVKGKGVASVPEDRKPKPTNFQAKRFIEEKEKDEDIPTDDEAKALKPCLYKIR